MIKNVMSPEWKYKMHSHLQGNCKVWPNIQDYQFACNLGSKSRFSFTVTFAFFLYDLIKNIQCLLERPFICANTDPLLLKCSLFANEHIRRVFVIQVYQCACYYDILYQCGRISRTHEKYKVKWSTKYNCLFPSKI